MASEYDKSGHMMAKLSSESALFGLKYIPGDRNEILDMRIQG
jgi:hypothetical protein